MVALEFTGAAYAKRFVSSAWMESSALDYLAKPSLNNRPRANCVGW